MMEALFGVLIGGLITWAVSYYYYVRAGNELRDEATKIRRLLALQLEVDEEQGLAEFVKDEHGEPKGRARHLKARVNAESQTSAAHLELNGPGGDGKENVHDRQFEG